MRRNTCCAIVGLLTMAVVMGGPAWAGDTTDQAELAKKTLNPVADLISLPLQFNYDHKIGPTDDGKKYVVNIQPVIPISIGPDWNVISRTILPLVDQDDILPDGSADATGIGEITQSFFFSPKAPQGKEDNWLQTVPGKSWFTILRMYGPLEPWINKTWRPGEIELMK